MMTALGLLILRLGIGLILAAHGAQKLFGWWGGPGMTKWAQAVQRLRIRPAQPWAWVAALSEFGGGLLLAIGLLSPLGSLAIVGAMLVAIATVHLAKGFWNGKGGFEFNLSLIVGAAALAITGPGSYSLDAALRTAFVSGVGLAAPGYTLSVERLATISTRFPSGSRIRAFRLLLPVSCGGWTTGTPAATRCP